MSDEARVFLPDDGTLVRLRELQYRIAKVSIELQRAKADLDESMVDALQAMGLGHTTHQIDPDTGEVTKKGSP